MMNMEQDTISVLDEIEKKCQKYAEEMTDTSGKEDNGQDDKSHELVEDETRTDKVIVNQGKANVTDDQNTETQEQNTSVQEEMTDTSGKEDNGQDDKSHEQVEGELNTCLDEHEKTANINTGECEVPDSDETESVKSLINAQENDNTQIDTETKSPDNDAIDGSEGHEEVTGEEDDKDNNSDIVAIDVNQANELVEDQTRTDKVIVNQVSQANELVEDETRTDKVIVNQGKANVTDDQNTETQEQNTSVQDESVQMNELSNQCNIADVSIGDDSYEDLDYLKDPSSIQVFRARKRRRRCSKNWSPISPYKARKLMHSSLRKLEDSIDADQSKLNDSVNTDKSTATDLDSTAEATDCTNAEQIAEGRRPMRHSRIHVLSKAEYIVGDEAVGLVIKQENSSKHKVRKGKSRLIDYGVKVDTGNVPPLQPDLYQLYSKPFLQGWQREIVYRGIYEETSAAGTPKPRACDIYYHPPKGAKIRSMVQVQDWLTKNGSDLTADNFSFMRRPIGIEEGEVVRQAAPTRGRASTPYRAVKTEAKKKGRRPKSFEPMSNYEDSDTKFGKPVVVIERDADEYINNIMHSAELGDGDLPPVRFDTTACFPKKGRPKKLLMHAKSQVKKEKIEMMHPSYETVIVTPPKHVKLKHTARKSTTPRAVQQQLSYSGIENLCTLKCPGLEGMAPMLMCKKCMCLFHHECVNYYDDDDDFRCLRCKSSQSQSSEIQKPPLVMKVSMPVKFSQLDQQNVSVSAVNSVFSQSLLTGNNFDVNRNTNLPSLLLVSSSSHSQSTTSVPIVSMSSMSSNNVQEIPRYPEIKPLLKVKEEPKDNSYDSSKIAGSQASTAALGSLKSILNSRSLSSPVNCLFPSHAADLNRSRTGSSPRMSTPTTFSNTARSKVLGNRMSPIINSSPASLLNNSSLQLSQNSNFRLIPIGPPVSLPNVPFQPIRLPGMTLQGLMPLSNLPPPIQSMNSTKATNLPLLDSQKNMHALSMPNSSQTLNCLSNMVSMVDSKDKCEMLSKQEHSPKKDNSAKGGNKAARLVIDGTTIGAPESGQLLTLPGAISRKLTLSKPLVLKIKNRQISVPPSGFFQASDGLKIFLPPNTFPTADEESENASGEKEKTNDVTDTNKQKDTDSAKDINTEKGISENDTNMEEKTSTKEANKQSKSEQQFRDICKSRYYPRSCLIQKLYGGYDCMYHIFRFLNIRGLLAVSQVCRTWRLISMHPSLWNGASFQGVRVSNWTLAMQFLNQRDVSSISLLGMCPYDDLERTWKDFITAVAGVPNIQEITFGLVPPLVLDSVCLKLTNLQSVCAQCVSNEDGGSMWTTPTRLDIGQFGSLPELRELRLKGVCSLSLPTFSLCGGLANLATLQHLETLCLTSLKNVEGSKFEFISELKNLKELALGECRGWTAETFAILGGQTSLHKLRLEHGGNIHDPGLGKAISKLQQLRTLELYTWTVADTFREHIQQLSNLRTLVIWPDNTNHQAEINTNTLTAVRDLQSLNRLKWVIMNRKNGGIILDDNDNTEAVSKEQEYIPFVSNTDENRDITEAARMTEYVGVRQLTENLSKLLPNTRINVYCLKSDQEPQDVNSSL